MVAILDKGELPIMVRTNVCKCKHMMSSHSVNQFQEYTMCKIDGCECKQYQFDHIEIHRAGVGGDHFEKLKVNKEKKTYKYKRILSMASLNSEGRPMN